VALVSFIAPEYRARTGQELPFKETQNTDLRAGRETCSWVNTQHVADRLRGCYALVKAKAYAKEAKKKDYQKKEGQEARQKIPEAGRD
jgi:hypothetical protein